MKRSFLTALGLEKAVIDQIMDEHGNTIETLKEKYTETETTLKEKVKTAADEAKSLQTKVKELETAAPGEDWETKYNELQEQFDQYKTEQEKTFNEFKQGVETEKRTAQIQAALSDRLIKDGANPKLVKLLLKEIDAGKAELKDGDIANYDDLTKTVKEGYSEVFGTVQTKGADTATPPANNGDAKPEFKFDFTPVRAAPQTNNKGE